MIKQNKEESYTNKAKSLVKYPKFKKRQDEQKKEEDDSSDRPSTYNVSKSSPEPADTRKEILEIIRTSKVLEEPEAVAKLLQVVKQFLKENTVEE